MFNKLKTAFSKNQPQPPQLSEEDRKKELDKKLLELTAWRIEDDKIPIIKTKVQALLAKGANINARGSKGATVLHNAVHQDKPTLVEFFICQGSEINAKDFYGQTPLYQIQSKAVTQQLLNAGADIWIKDNDKCTPLEGSLKKQEQLLVTKRALPKSIYGNPQPHHEANETLAKAYLREKPNFERPNCHEELISKSKWESWKKETLEASDALTTPLAPLPSTNSTIITESIQHSLEEKSSLIAAMSLLEQSTQRSCQQEVDNKIIKSSHFVSSIFTTQSQIVKETKCTESEKKLKLAN